MSHSADGAASDPAADDQACPAVPTAAVAGAPDERPGPAVAAAGAPGDPAPGEQTGPVWCKVRGAGVRTASREER